MKKIIIQFFYLKNKPFVQKYQHFIIGITLHTLIFWGALVAGYNSFKEYVQQYNPLPGYERDAIINTFPWAILIFACLYFILYWSKKRTTIFLNIWQYIISIILSIIVFNAFFIYYTEEYKLVTYNLSILYFIVFLIVLKSIFIFSEIHPSLDLQDYLPPIAYRTIIKHEKKIQLFKLYSRKNPSQILMIIFIILLFVCALFLCFRVSKAAEQVANVAYFALVIGIGLEMYNIIKQGKTK